MIQTKNLPGIWLKIIRFKVGCFVMTNALIFLINNVIFCAFSWQQPELTMEMCQFDVDHGTLKCCGGALMRSDSTLM